MNKLQAVRRAFEQAAPHYDASAFLQKEVALRLAEHFEGMKINPQIILDAGCGTGHAIPQLRKHFPNADIVALDLAEGMVKETLRQHGPSNGWRHWLASFTTNSTALGALVADIQQLPLATHSIDLIWSNLALQWVDLDAALRSTHRVLRPGGLFIFTSFGPDTLKELRAASEGLDGHAHVNRFIDMHDVGDALVRAGFADPVMEMERITLTYSDLKDLLRDLKGVGAQTVLERGRQGLMGKATWQRLRSRYESFRHAGRLPATYEIVYGHAWGAEKRQLDDGRQIIHWADKPR